MARKDDLLVGGAETILGSGVKVKGTLHSDGDINIDGHLTGDIKATGNVSIGVNAVVKANVGGANVTVAGDLEGNVTASGETAITATGRIRGDITSTTLAIASGGVFHGSSHLTAESPRSSATEKS